MAGPDHHRVPDEGGGGGKEESNNSGVRNPNAARAPSSLRATMSLADMKQGRGSTVMMTRGCNASVKVGDFPLNVPFPRSA